MELFRQYKVLASHLNEIGQLRALDSLTKVNLIVSKFPNEIKTKYAEYKSLYRHLTGYNFLSVFSEYQFSISRECCVALQSTLSSKVDSKEVKCYTCSGSKFVISRPVRQKNKNMLH